MFSEHEHTSFSARTAWNDYGFDADCLRLTAFDREQERRKGQMRRFRRLVTAAILPAALWF
jgi:hypothetical protein